MGILSTIIENTCALSLHFCCHIVILYFKTAFFFVGLNTEKDLNKKKKTLYVLCDIRVRRKCVKFRKNCHARYLNSRKGCRILGRKYILNILHVVLRYPHARVRYARRVQVSYIVRRAWTRWIIRALFFFLENITFARNKYNRHMARMVWKTKKLTPHTPSFARRFFLFFFFS